MMTLRLTPAWNPATRALRILSLLLPLLFAGTGCELSDADGSTSTATNAINTAENTPPPVPTPVADPNVVGTWVLYEGTEISGEPFWYIHFNPDGTFTISNNPDGSEERVHGTYEVSGNSISGPFVNPGTGDGHIDATITEGILQLDFVEHWHTPYKVVPYAGTRI
jgi:hypothetical protein